MQLTANFTCAPVSDVYQRHWTGQEFLSLIQQKCQLPDRKEVDKIQRQLQRQVAKTGGLKQSMKYKQQLLRVTVKDYLGSNIASAMEMEGTFRADSKNSTARLNTPRRGSADRRQPL